MIDTKKDKIEFEGSIGDRDEAGLTYCKLGKPHFKDTFFWFLPTKFVKKMKLKKFDKVKITITKVDKNE